MTDLHKQFSDYLTSENQRYSEQKKKDIVNAIIEKRSF